jgi:protein-disulfide isomerase
LFLIILLYIKFTSYDNTPVVIDAYLDYASQYSKDTYAVLQQLSAESPSLIVTYHLVGTSEQSISAAHAFFCAAQQGREKEYLNYIFTTETDFETAAQTLGLDTALFGNCMIEPYTSDADEISYTPTVFVNDNKIVGAVGYETIQRVVENEMN